MSAWWGKLFGAIFLSAIVGAVTGVSLSPLAVRAQQFVPVSQQQLVDWGEALLEKVDPKRTTPVPTQVSDHFGPIPYGSPHWWDHALAAGGRKLETAGSGSLWVYDPVRHFAASTEGGDAQGDVILYVNAPPGVLPVRDLSRVISMHGLHLGISSSLAARDLGVPPSAVTRLSAHRTMLYARINRTCGPYTCAHDATIVFDDDSAIAIALFELGP